MASFINSVSTVAQINNDISLLDTGAVTGANTITLTSNISLAGTVLDAFNLGTNASVTIVGNGNTLDGGGTQRGLFVYAGTVTVDNLTIANTKAVGGAGGAGAGGGAGLGGGLFIGDNVAGDAGNVTLNNVTFTNDKATGGQGGAKGSQGGGGGLGGAGGSGPTDTTQSVNSSGGGGGGIGSNATGGVYNQGVVGSDKGGKGIVIGASGGGSGENNTGGAGGSGGGSGGGGGSASTATGGGGGGGVGGAAGHLAGNLSTGGSGGYGGGGGAGTQGAGGGGFGGGGGSSQLNSLHSGHQGAGGFGGGGGMAGGIGGFGAGAGASNVGSGGGGGGLGAGGDIFVQQGGVLNIASSTLYAGSVTGGTVVTGATAGSAFGSGIFLQGNETITIGSGQTIGQSTTILGVIADQTGSGGTGTLAGAGSLNIAGLGAVDLNADNTYTGTTTINGGTVVLGVAHAAGSGTIAFSGTGDVLAFGTTAAPANIISGFAAGRTIEVVGATIAGPFSGGSSVVLTASDTLHFSGSISNFVVTDSGGNTFLTTICFCPGTKIRTPNGETKVEHLSVGDTVVTLGHNTQTITWIGKGKVLATRGKRGPATPVIVRKSALADNVPNEDLHVTKGHAFYLDNVLIPVEFLVNHKTILWDDRAQEVEIYHIELARHDVLFANGAPAESYRDDGNRWLFQNHNEGWGQPEKQPFAPILTGGPAVDDVWLRLLNRAGPRKLPPMTDDPDLHLMADGQWIDVARSAGSDRVFYIPWQPREVRIVSRDMVPAEFGFSRDARSLGVALRQIAVHRGVKSTTIEANDSRLTEGFHDYEPSESLRWTNGNATLPEELLLLPAWGATKLVLTLAGTAQYPEDTAFAAA